MILDKIQNKKSYANLNDKFQKAFKFLTENNLEELAVGKYEIDGNDVYAMVQAYTTKMDEEIKWETHKKYIDIQYVVKGTEVVGWMPMDELTESEAYSEEKDITFYGETSKWTKLVLNSGVYAIFFPEDAHKPCCTYDKKVEEVKKVVVKIKL